MSSDRGRPGAARHVRLGPVSRAAAGAVGVVAAVILVHAGLGLMGDYAVGSASLLPLPRSKEAVAPAAVLLVAGVGLAVYCAGLLGETLVAALLPEWPSAARVWRQLSPEMRARLRTAAAGGFTSVQVTDELSRELALLGKRQRHLRAVGPEVQAIARMSAQLAAIARHPSSGTVIAYDNIVV